LVQNQEFDKKIENNIENSKPPILEIHAVALRATRTLQRANDDS
jgi:hypothetical protein